MSRLSEKLSGMFIPDPASEFFLSSRIQGPNKKAPDPGYGSATLFYNSGMTEQNMQSVNQCFGSESALVWSAESGSALRMRIRIRRPRRSKITQNNVLDPDWFWSARIRICIGMGVRIQEGRNDRKKWRNFMFGIAGCSLLRAEGFSCSLESI